MKHEDRNFGSQYTEIEKQSNNRIFWKKEMHGSLTFDFAADSRTLATKGTTYSSSYRISSISAPFCLTFRKGREEI
jgi:hypothetical protein